MKYIQLRPDNLVWYNALHFGHDTLMNPGLVNQQVNKDLTDSDISLVLLAGKKLILSFIGEGQDPDIIQHLISQLKTWPVADMLVVFSACVNVDTLSYRAISYPDCMINHRHWLDNIKSQPPSWQVDHKFLCLMRRPSPSRARLANALLTNTNNVKLSFGCMSHSNVLTEYQALIPGYNLPILIDGIIDRQGIYDEHDQSDPVFKNCLFNIVVETSSQTDPGWRSRFITEKTFKAFGLRQIPLWMAVPGLVAKVKDMGFDLFDDIVDHGYDCIQDEYQRQQNLIEQIKKLDQLYTLDQCQHLRNQLQPRLEHNFQLLRKKFQTSLIAIEEHLKKFQESIP
jgi:hypothetical protein